MSAVEFCTSFEASSTSVESGSKLDNEVVSEPDVVANDEGFPSILAFTSTLEEERTVFSSLHGERAVGVIDS